MMTLSSKIILDISSKLSGMALTTTGHGVMAPCVSKASFSTSNHLDSPIAGMSKRPLTGFFRYCMEMRPMVVRQNPNLKAPEVAKVLGQKYKELPIGKKMDMKEAYQNEMKIYQKELEEFKTTPEGKEIMEKMSQQRKEKKLKNFKISLRNLKSEMGLPKQPASAFNLFVKDQTSGKPGANVTNKIKDITEKWKAMNERQKTPYVQKYNQLKTKYEEDLAKWKAKQSEEGIAKIDAIQKKILATRNDIKGIVPKPKVAKKKKKVKKVVAKKVKKAKPAVKKTTTKKVTEKAPAKATKKAKV